MAGALSGGGPGQVGNVLSANGPSWNLGNATLLSVVPNPDPVLIWKTTYMNGVLTLLPGGPWDGGGAPYTVNLGPLTVLSSGALPNNMLVWQMDASGPVTGSGETTFITAGFNGVFTPIPTRTSRNHRGWFWGLCPQTPGIYRFTAQSW